MAEGPDLTEIVRRTVQANARFYKGWVDLSLDYMRGISEIFAPGQIVPPSEEVEAGPGVVVLEAEAGNAAKGAFLVTNDLGRDMVCELVSSDFADASGGRIGAQPRFDPPKVELAPGEQKVVQVVIPIDDKLTAGVAYNGQFSIKGMDGFSVPVVLRRQHRVEESPIDREAPSPTRAAKPTGKGGKKQRASQPQGTARKR